MGERERLEQAIAALEAQRAALRWWQRGMAEAERMAAPYEIGMLHLELGERLGDRAHLEQAEAVLAQSGAQLDLARAREILRGANGS